MTFVYGMQLRGFSPGCQPKDGLLGLADYAGTFWDVSKYCDCIEYDRQLTEKELTDLQIMNWIIWERWMHNA